MTIDSLFADALRVGVCSGDLLLVAVAFRVIHLRMVAADRTRPASTVPPTLLLSWAVLLLIGFSGDIVAVGRPVNASLIAGAVAVALGFGAARTMLAYRTPHLVRVLREATRRGSAPRHG